MKIKQDIKKEGKNRKEKEKMIKNRTINETERGK
jgi:hypothetical protein